MSSEPSGNATILYFDRDQFVGERDLYCCGYATSSGERHSAYWPCTAYFCPHCGEIWGRAVYDFSFTYSPIPSALWVTETRRCPSHGDGTFLSGYAGDHLSQCSTELLHREALILCLSNPTKELLP